MFLLLAAAVTFSNPGQVSAPASSGRVEHVNSDLGCFVNKDPMACEANTSRDGSEEADRDYLEVACLTANYLSSCVRLGGWYFVRHQTAEANSYYTRACTATEQSGCLKLLQSRLTKVVEGINPEELSKIVSEAKTLTLQFCPATAKPTPLCEQAAKEIANAQSVNEHKVCRISQWYTYLDNIAPVEKSYDVGKMLRDECLKRCAVSMTGDAGPMKEAVRLRRQCVFDGRAVGAESWKLLITRKTCNEDARRMGEQNLPYYQKCFCENLQFDQVGELTRQAGVFWAPGTSDSRHFGTEVYFRCSLLFHFIDPVAAHHDAANCTKDIKGLKQKLSSEKVLQDYNLNYDDLKCQP